MAWNILPRVLLICFFSVVGLFPTGCTKRPDMARPAEPTISSASGAATGAGYPSPLVVSVLYFEDRTRVPELAWVRKGMADMLVSSLARVPTLVVVQRERLDEVVREQMLQLSGRTADDPVVRAGRLTGATVLVSGSVTHSQGIVRIDAQVVGVENGTVLGTAVAEGQAADVLTVAKNLVGKVVEILPTGDAPATMTTASTTENFVSAVRANEAGEILNRQGKLFEALAEFERAMRADPGYSVARSNFDQVVRGLSGTELLRAPSAEGGVADPRKVVERIVERVMRLGLKADVSPAQTEIASDGVVTLRIPMRLRLAPEAVEAVVDAARLLGGEVKPLSSKDGPLKVRLSSRHDLNREFVRVASDPMRAYLRLFTTTGRTVAVYSDVKEWRLASWITPVDDQHVQIYAEKVLHTEVLLTRLTPEQAYSVASVRVTVDPVPRERATVRLDMLEVEGSGSADHHPDSPGLRSLRALRPLMEDAWTPTLLERTWRPGYLPTNQRTSVVGAIVQTGRPGIVESARLIRGSGDADFDQAALDATRQALEKWQRDPAQPMPTGKTDTSRPTERPIKLRVSYSLHEDVPALNLIGPTERTTALVAPLARTATP